MRSPGDRSRRTALTLIAVLAAVPTAGALAQTTAPADKPPVPELTVMIAKTTKSRQSVQGKLGNYCLPSTDGTATCKTAKYPLPDLPKIKVSKGEQITLLFKAPVGYVSYYTARVNSATKKEVGVGSGEGEQVTKTKKRWRLTLPKNLRKSATVLGVFVQYVNAYSSYEIGIQVR